MPYDYVAYHVTAVIIVSVAALLIIGGLLAIVINQHRIIKQRERGRE